MNFRNLLAAAALVAALVAPTLGEAQVYHHHGRTVIVRHRYRRPYHRAVVVRHRAYHHRRPAIVIHP